MDLKCETQKFNDKISSKSEIYRLGIWESWLCNEDPKVGEQIGFGVGVGLIDPSWCIKRTGRQF